MTCSWQEFGTEEEITRIIDRALQEDLAGGDITSEALFGPDHRSTGVVGARLRLGLAAREPTRASRVVGARGGAGGAGGLLVDRVSEVLRGPEEAFRAAASDSGRVESLCIEGERFVSILDLERVLETHAEPDA